MTTTWEKVRRIDSSNPMVFKYVFEQPNAVAESVLYQYPTFEERTVICCSSQSGCPIGCRFCGAGDAFVRSLTTEEILAQVKHVLADHNVDTNKVKRMQIMFMSMGEPLLNLKNLIPALRQLYIDYPKAALLISTIGPEAVDMDSLLKISMEIPTIGLQFSVHESTNEARNQLIPFKAKRTLESIAQTGQLWASCTGRQPFFNYCAHDKNSSNADADRLAVLFDPKIWQATISVICERDELPDAPNDHQRDLAGDFAGLLLKRGYSTRVFDPAGQQSAAGCGQLWETQKWMREHPALAKKSAGRGLPIIHAPRALALP